MWKNNLHSKNLASVRRYYSVEGLNQDRLLNLLASRGIVLYDVKKSSPSKMTFSISVKQDKKFFAIVKEICYNNSEPQEIHVAKPLKRGFFAKIRQKRKQTREKVIAIKKVGGYNITKLSVKGMGYPLYFLLNNLGILAGVLALTVISAVANDYIFSFSFVGSGSVFQSQAEDYLKEQGVDLYDRFSEFDLKKLSGGILASNSNLTFAQIYKRGNKMVIELVAGKSAKPPLDDSVQSLVASDDGVVESIVVYRGTAVVNQGDKVNKGDLLVDGKEYFNEQEILTNVLAKVTIRCEYVYEYISDRDGEELYAELFAKNAFLGEVQDCIVEKTQFEDKYAYKVTLYYIQVITAG